MGKYLRKNLILNLNINYKYLRKNLILNLNCKGWFITLFRLFIFVPFVSWASK